MLDIWRNERSLGSPPSHGKSAAQMHCMNVCVHGKKH